MNKPGLQGLLRRHDEHSLRGAGAEAAAEGVELVLLGEDVL